MKDENDPDTHPILFRRFAALFSLRVVEKRAYLPNLVPCVGLSIAAALYAHYVATALLQMHGVTVAMTFIVLFIAGTSNLSIESNGVRSAALAATTE